MLIVLALGLALIWAASFVFADPAFLAAVGDLPPIAQGLAGVLALLVLAHASSRMILPLVGRAIEGVYLGSHVRTSRFWLPGEDRIVEAETAHPTRDFTGHAIGEIRTLWKLGSRYRAGSAIKPGLRAAVHVITAAGWLGLSIIMFLALWSIAAFSAYGLSDATIDMLGGQMAGWALSPAPIAFALGLLVVPAVIVLVRESGAEPVPVKRSTLKPRNRGFSRTIHGVVAGKTPGVVRGFHDQRRQLHSEMKAWFVIVRVPVEYETAKGHERRDEAFLTAEVSGPDYDFYAERSKVTLSLLPDGSVSGVEPL